MLKEITMFEFDKFASENELFTYFQTSNYAILKSEEGYDYEYIGYFEQSKLVAASVILVKRLSVKFKYAYAPRGILMDYHNPLLIKKISDSLKKYLNKKNIIFLKIDPLIVTKEYEAKSKDLINVRHVNLDYILQNNGFKKLKDNLYFESQLPRYRGVVDLTKYTNSKLNKNCRNKVKKSLTKGLTLEKVSIDKLDVLYNILKRKYKYPQNFYNNLYKVFSDKKMIDLFLVKIDYENFMESAKRLYDSELTINGAYNNLLKLNNNERNLNKKIASDKRLVGYKNDIMEASRKYSDNELTDYVAAAIIMKTKNSVEIAFSAYNPFYKRLNVNYFLHYALINYYKSDAEQLIFNSLTGNFSKDSPYKGLNDFYFSFNPVIEELIGEFDLIVNKKIYEKFLVTGKLHAELDKT